MIEKGIVVEPYDYVNLPLNSKLHRKNLNNIFIKRAVPVKVIANGTEKVLLTTANTVEEVLKNSQYKLYQSDKLCGVKPSDKVIPNMKFQVIKVKEEISSEKIHIPYKVVTRENDNLDKGIQKTIKQGSEGLREKVYKTIFEDSKQISKQLLTDNLVTRPVDMIIECGTILNHKTSRGDTIRYKKRLVFSATAYTSSYEDTGKRPGDPYFGITFTGAKAKKGIIAVDPSVIPLGTRVYVETYGSMPDYGYAVAADTGGAIKGSIIDLYFDDQTTVSKWGRRKVNIYILNKGKRD